jgi:hypothetical protein
MKLASVNSALAVQKSDFLGNRNTAGDGDGINSGELYRSLFGLGKRFQSKQIRVEKSGKKRWNGTNEYISTNNNNSSTSNAKSVELAKKSNNINNGVLSKSIMSVNERRKLVQNNLESNMLNLMRKSLDDQSNKVQLQLKREESMIFDEFIEAKVINYNFTRRRKLIELRNESSSKMNSSRPPPTESNPIDSNSKLPSVAEQPNLKLEAGLKFRPKLDHFTQSKTAHPNLNNKDGKKSAELDNNFSESMPLFTEEEEEIIKKAFKLNSNLFDRYILICLLFAS